MDDPLEAIEDDEVLDLYWVDVSRFTRRGRANGGGRFVREAVSELDGGRERPYLVHAWRQGLSED